MAVAKSYQNLEIINEPYVVSGRKYVDVRTTKGTIKRVRWYSDNEYRKMYPETEPAIRQNKPLKEILGFSEGFVTIFYGNTYEVKDWFVGQKARYNEHFGWYMPDGKMYEGPLPVGVQTAVINWSDVSENDNCLKSSSTIKSFMETIIYPEDESNFVGSVGERIEVEITVEKNVTVEGYYGITHIHIMRDGNRNVYVWSTTSKNWEEGSVKKIKGTIKEHKVYKNTKQTVLTRCSSEVK